MNDVGKYEVDSLAEGLRDAAAFTVVKVGVRMMSRHGRRYFREAMKARATFAAVAERQADKDKIREALLRNLDDQRTRGQDYHFGIDDEDLPALIDEIAEALS